MIEFMVRMYLDEDGKFGELEKRFSYHMLPRRGEWLHLFGDSGQDLYAIDEVHHDLVDTTKLPVVSCSSGVKGNFAKELRDYLKKEGWKKVKYK